MNGELKAQQAGRNLQTQAVRHVLSPRTQLSLKLLGMPYAELSSYIDRQLAENPFLSPADEPLDVGNPRSSETYSSSVYSTMLSEDIYIDEPILEDMLLQQLHELDIPYPLEKATESLISQLDEHGFLAYDGALSSIDHQALVVLQSLSPAGIGARNLQECLKIQLARHEESTALAKAIIDKYLPEAAKREYRVIAENLGVSPEDVKRTVGLISSLSPIPSRGYRTSKEPEIVQPEAYIELVDDVLTIGMRTYISINRQLLDSFGESSLPANLESEYRAASVLVSLMDYRASTLEKVLSIVAKVQHDALIHDPSRLKPLTMADVAEKLSLSPSTITRAVQGKWIQAPSGLMRLRDCFVSGVSRTEDSHSDEIEKQAGCISAAHIKSLISELIRHEDHANPLSDQDILIALESQSLHLSRRTVAKYRTELGITSSKARGVE